MVNSLIRENLSTSTNIQSIDQAMDVGAIALFGKKYDDQVRVVNIGDSKELCSGTHVKRTGEIGLFKIVTECSIASGIRRIEALTGQEAINYVRSNEINLKRIAKLIKAPASEIMHRLDILNQERKESEAKIKILYKKLVEVENIKSIEVNGICFMSHAFTDIPVNIIREFTMQQQNLKTLIVFTITEKNKTFLQSSFTPMHNPEVTLSRVTSSLSPSKKSNKTILIVKISKDLVDKINAKELVSTIIGRNCGGNAEIVQTGCDNSNIIRDIYNYLVR